MTKEPVSKVLCLGNLYNALDALETITDQVHGLNRGLAPNEVESLRAQPWYQEHLQELIDGTTCLRRHYEEFHNAAVEETRKSVQWYTPEVGHPLSLHPFRATIDLMFIPEQSECSPNLDLMSMVDPNTFVTVNDKVTGSSCSIAVAIAQLHNTNYPH